ncbi:UDP-glucose/GDP-mannose dehydrogenase family, UDP binding domain-containing protein [Neocallimastix lanati (nom. inval.)]|nr:UDP-glucose/GDP-mannose dehydrogenase family, UDP binding domain-containing protein [Neocallimastix sp. JGI-2020a]
MTARKIANISKNSKIIIEKSTVPCKTADHIRTILNANKINNGTMNKYNKLIHENLENNNLNICNLSISRSSSNSTLNNEDLKFDNEPIINDFDNKDTSIHFEILSNPEFLAEGTAVNDILYPDRILIGGNETKEGRIAQEILCKLYSYWVPQENIIKMGLWSAELSKLSANALLAQRISSINSQSALCEETGADIQEIALACGLDSRIGSKFLNASIGKIIAIYGFSFKKNTKDTRESPALTVVLSLLKEGAIIKIFDPKVPENQIKNDIKENCDFQENNEYISNISVCHSCYEASYGANAIVICTEWDEFKSLDYKRIYNDMSKPAFIFDGRLILNHKELKQIGFSVEAIGKQL